MENKAREMRPKFKDNRYRRAIKVALNRFFASKSGVHKHIAALISEFSHKTLMEKNTCLMNKRLQFFVVSEILSAHFCKGYYCPYIINRNQDGFIYIPNLWYCSTPSVKKIHEPFSRMPFVKDRSHKFLPREKIQRYGKVQTYRSIFEQVY